MARHPSWPQSFTTTSSVDQDDEENKSKKLNLPRRVGLRNPKTSLQLVGGRTRTNLPALAGITQRHFNRCATVRPT
jgi:hypothetical protein